ncbi:MAG: ABC transporter permease subunit [Planctomycetota bacterium]
MLRFLARRLLWFGITIMTVMTVSFFLMHSVKGGPFDDERALDPVIEANIKARYHLDWPLWRQYLHYIGPFNLDDQRALLAPEPGGDKLGLWRSELPDGEPTKAFGGVFAGDFGPSFRYKDFTVNEILSESRPITMLLGVLSMMFALSLGISAGIASALRPGSGLDLALRLAATGGIALPNFVIASFLIIVLVFLLPLLPVAGWGTIQHMLLPGFCLGLVFAAYIARLTRTGMLETLSADYIRTAHAKGLSPRTVVMRHALKGGLLPVVSYLGPATAGILTGSLVIEKIFFIPGTGSHFINAATNRDYTLAMGVTILFTVLVYTLNTLVDMAYTLLDPRISLEDE